MSLRSMTAFVRLRHTGKLSRWGIELRSVNNRYLDLSLRVPAIFNDFETDLRELVQSRIHRGKVLLSILEESDRKSGDKPFQLNEHRIREALTAFKKIQKKFGLTGDFQVRDLMNIPGVFEMEEAGEKASQIWSGLKKSLDQALQLFAKAKALEGEKLALDISKRLTKISDAVKRIETLSQGTAEAVAARLKERIQKILEGNTPELADERWQREVAFLAEKSDVTEEIVRLRSHLSLFQSKLKKGGEVGRELDFLCQELNREANTIGSKSQSFEISKEVLLIKSELEKIREQVQNIE